MPNKLTYGEALQGASSFLAARHKDEAAAKYVLLERLHWTTTDWLVHLNDPIAPAVVEQLWRDVAQLLQDYPPQYILGYCYFYDRPFAVNQHTLIPRPETEELVKLCLDQHPANLPLKVADIGTGTGCIAITLKKERPAWQLVATDIDQETLQVAKENAERHDCSLDLRLGNLTQPLAGDQYDLIISNPPYIAATEWPLMDLSVRKYEPRQALFAEDEGLAIYRQLAQDLPTVLKQDGELFFEIGFRQGAAVQAIFQAAFPAKKVEIFQDLSGHDRMLTVR